MMKWTRFVGLVAAVPCLLAAPVTAQLTELDPEEELRLAMSAGPAAVSANADLYLMGDRGFTKAVSGSNGFACLVVRSAADADILAPHCLNPDAVATVLPALLREGELQARGHGQDRIRRTLDAEFESGALPLPSGPAFAYMFSDGQRLGPNAGRFQPHFMLYVPNISNADIGGDPSAPEFPFVGPFENQPLSTVVVLTPEFVRPQDMQLPEGWRTTRR